MRNRHDERSKRKLFFRIFGVLAVIFLAWVIFFLSDSKDDHQAINPADTLAHNDVKTVPAEVSDFLTFVKLSTDTVVSEETKEYTRMGIEQLSVTLESFIQRNSGAYHSMTKQTDELRQISKDLEISNDDNSSKAKKAFLIAADLLENIKGSEEAYDVKSKAEGIQEDLPLEQQLDSVKSYFITFADALKEMTGMEYKRML